MGPSNLTFLHASWSLHLYPAEGRRGTKVSLPPLLACVLLELEPRLTSCEHLEAFLGAMGEGCGMREGEEGGLQTLVLRQFVYLLPSPVEPAAMPAVVQPCGPGPQDSLELAHTRRSPAASSPKVNLSP